MANEVLMMLKGWLKERGNIDPEELDIVTNNWIKENKSQKVIEIDEKVRKLYPEIEAMYKRLMDELCDILISIFEYGWSETYSYYNEISGVTYTIHPKTHSLEIGENYILESTESEIEYNINHLKTEKILDLISPKNDFIENFPAIMHKLLEEYLSKFDMDYQDLSKKYWELVNIYKKEEE